MAQIKITREQLPHVISKAFDLSQPQGMGYLHYKPGPIPEDTLDRILERTDNNEGYRKGVSLDYVEGRAVKLYIPYEPEYGYYMEDDGRWFDHSNEAWEELTTFIKTLP